MDIDALPDPVVAIDRIVSRHRSRLAIDSTPRDGSTFSVHLPLAGLTAHRRGAQEG